MKSNDFFRRNQCTTFGGKIIAHSPTQNRNSCGRNRSFCNLCGIKRNLSSDDLLVSFLPFGNLNKADSLAPSRIREVSLFIVLFLTRGKYCCIELPAIYVRMKAHTAGIFQSNIFPSLTAQAKIRKNLLPKGKSKFDHAKSRIICTTYYLQKGADML